MWGYCHFRAQNGPLVLNNFFFGTSHYYYFHLPIGPFHCAKFKKILTADPELWRCAIFEPKMVYLPQTIFFFGKLLLSFSSTYYPLSLSKIFKNSSSGSRVIRMRNFWAQNGPFAKMRIFSENLLMSLVSSIHAYLYAKNQSQILIYLWNIDN